MITKREVNRRKTLKKYRDMYQDMVAGKSYEQMMIDYEYTTLASIRATFQQSIMPYILSIEKKRDRPLTVEKKKV